MNSVAKLQFNDGEAVIGSGMMAYQEPVGMFRYRSWRGYIYITNQRAFFRMSMSGMLMMDLLLPEIKGFMVSKRFFITAVTICSRDGKDFKFTGFPAKKLQDWLQQAGISKI